MAADKPPFGHFIHPDEYAATSSITSPQFPEEGSSDDLFLPYFAPPGAASATPLQQADIFNPDVFDMDDTDLDSLFTDDNIPEPTLVSEDHPPIAPKPLSFSNVIGSKTPVSFSNAVTPSGYPAITSKPAPYPTMIAPYTSPQNTPLTSPSHQTTPTTALSTSQNNILPHPPTKHYAHLTDSERTLLKRMQSFVEDYEALKKEMQGSKAQAGSKYKMLVGRLDRCVQMHLKNGVPRIARGKGMGGAKAEGA